VFGTHLAKEERNEELYYRDEYTMDVDTTTDAFFAALEKNSICHRVFGY